MIWRPREVVWRMLRKSKWTAWWVRWLSTLYTRVARFGWRAIVCERESVCDIGQNHLWLVDHPSEAFDHSHRGLFHPCLPPSLPLSLSPSHRWHQVSLKIIKHCQEEGSSSELVTGFLVGLVVGKTLEVTNCFPLPKDLDDTEEESEYIATVSHTHKTSIRPGELDLLFRISHLLNLHVGGRSFFIIHYYHMLPTRTRQIYDGMAIRSGHVIAWKAIIP